MNKIAILFGFSILYSIFALPPKNTSMRTGLILLILIATSLRAQPGANCAEALPAIAGASYTPTALQTWYMYTATADGWLLASTCGLSTCDTRVAVYDHCTGLVTDDAGLNAIGYSDNTCFQQSLVRTPVLAGQDYYVRISGQAGCSPASMPWKLALEPACSTGEASVHIEVDPDNWPQENSWDLVDANGVTVANGAATSTALCIDDNGCLTLRVHDTFGDGMLGSSGFWFFIDEQYIGSATGDFDFLEEIEGNCPPGSTCSSALPSSIGVNTAFDAGTWYTFTPAENGAYGIGTCSYNICDTRIWLYDHCEDLIWDETNIGTIGYNDDGCDQQSIVTAMLEAGVTYWIRIGDANGSCVNEDIEWEITYNGPITGCMDPTACNYNPLATVDDGSCLPQGDPDCPEAPDLFARQDVLETSLSQSIEDLSTNYLCLLNEGCVSGFGVRELVRFTTRIDNIGEQDFYIGIPTPDNPQFNYDPCHGHYHFVGYAEYLLYDQMGQQRAQGFKNGFCVFDLTCGGGVDGQYTCANQGLTAGCGDFYASGLTCQWIDITDVEDGDYKLVVRVNWDQDPDAVGRVESDFSNNWAQVCINIDRTPSLLVTLIEPCLPYVDCQGTQFGSAQMDCNGVCAGTALIGDLDVDLDQDPTDCDNYIDGILDDALTASACNDANDDGTLSVTDVAMVAHCHEMNLIAGEGEHELCEFPRLEINNIFDPVTFSLGAFDEDNSSVDILMKNPERRQVGYELRMTGLHVTGVQSLVDAADFPVVLDFSENGHILGVSYVDSSIVVHASYIPILRVFFDSHEAQFCLSEVVDIVNEDYHNGIASIEDGCLITTGVSTASSDSPAVLVIPEGDGSISLIADIRTSDAVCFDVMDAQGRVVRTSSRSGAGRHICRLNGLAGGAYVYRLSGGTTAIGSFVIR